MNHPTITIREIGGVLRHESNHFDAEEGWDLPVGTYELVSVVEGERRIHITTVGGEWPFNVTQEMFSAFGRLAARREKWWRGNLAADILDLLAGLKEGDG